MMETAIIVNWGISDRLDKGLMYARLVKVSDDSLIISADLAYILRSASEHEYKIVNLQQIMLELVEHGYRFYKRGT